jgi:hypothetical protein
MKILTISLIVVCVFQAIYIFHLSTPAPPQASSPTPTKTQTHSRPTWFIDNFLPKIKQGAEAALNKWTSQNPNESDQISGAIVETVEPAGPYIYVRMKKKQTTPQHIVYQNFFHVVMNEKCEVLFVERGPDLHMD